MPEPKSDTVTRTCSESPPRACTATGTLPATVEVLAFKPAFEAGLQADVNPIPSVRLSLGYNYVSRTKVDGVQADPVSNLYLHGSYELFKDILLYARLNNLLNQDYQYYEGCPAQGFSLMGGVAFRF